MGQKISNSLPGKTKPYILFYGFGGLLVIIIMIAYFPAIQNGYIWDDDAHIINNLALRTLDGLKSIWFEPGSIPQYYPLTHTTFWIEYQIWQLNPFGYHLVNVLLHALNALLLLVILSRLNLPWAWFAAALFALHPVHVESVAWVSERKNILSTFFYLSSLVVYLEFAKKEFFADTNNRLNFSNTLSPVYKEKPAWILYSMSLVLYICALLSKTVACSLPAAILLLLWWKTGRIKRHHFFLLLPYFAIGVGLSLNTVMIEKYHVGAQGAEWELSFVERCLIAGRALWFYAGKLIWPVDLTFSYPRWHIDAGVWYQYLFPATAVIGILSLLFLHRSVGRGAFVAVCLFSGTLFPALGFIDVYPMRYSFVADHFQYLASISLITLGCAVLAIYSNKLSKQRLLFVKILVVLYLSMLGILTWHQSHIYKSKETLWRDTIAKNPDSWMAHYNLGLYLKKAGMTDEAIDYYRRAIELKPDHVRAHYNLGNALAQQNEHEAAIRKYHKTLQLDPAYIGAHTNLGIIFAKKGNLRKAGYHFKKALEIDPRDPEGLYNYGVYLLNIGRRKEAIYYLSKVLKVNPNHHNTERAKDAILEVLKENPNLLMQ